MKMIYEHIFISNICFIIHAELKKYIYLRLISQKIYILVRFSQTFLICCTL